VSAPAGLLLLTGGQSARFGEPKHLQPHPAGGTWGTHLVDVFEDVFPGCPVQILGEGLPDRPEYPALADPRQGPAVALEHWAGLTGGGQARRWWVAACDQVRWTPATLDSWYTRAVDADPWMRHWVLARHRGEVQYLGGWLSGDLVPELAGQRATSLWALAKAVPCLELGSEGDQWLDVDTPEALKAWREPGSG